MVYVILILAMDTNERLRQNKLNDIYIKYKSIQFKTNDLLENIMFGDKQKSKQKLKEFNRIKHKILKYDNDMRIFKKMNNRY